MDHIPIKAVVLVISSCRSRCRVRRVPHRSNHSLSFANEVSDFPSKLIPNAEKPHLHQSFDSKHHIEWDKGRQSSLPNDQQTTTKSCSCRTQFKGHTGIAFVNRTPNERIGRGNKIPEKTIATKIPNERRWAF